MADIKAAAGTLREVSEEKGSILVAGTTPMAGEQDLVGSRGSQKFTSLEEDQQANTTLSRYNQLCQLLNGSLSKSVELVSEKKRSRRVKKLLPWVEFVRATGGLTVWPDGPMLSLCVVHAGEEKVMMRLPEKLDEGLFDELIFYFAPQVALFAAVKLGVFSAIENGGNRVADIASAAKCSARGVRMLLDCLSAMGLLEKRGEDYRLNHCSKKFFLPSSDDYVGSLFFHLDQFMRLWLTLPEAVRSGRSTLGFSSRDEKERWNIDLVGSLFEVHKRVAWQLADRLKQSTGFMEGDDSPRILDVAAGSAVWSIPFAQKWARAEVVAIDFLPILAVARKYTRRFGVESRYRFREGDIREIEIGVHEFDLCILGHICHSEGERWSRKLIEKCFRALKDKGKVLIMDYLADEKGGPEILPSLLALNTLLGTDEGDTFSFDQYRRWMLDAGFHDAKAIEIHGHSPIIVGYKA